MAERVVVVQDQNFQTGFSASDPHGEATDSLSSVSQLHELTPYGMLLASLGACTAIVLNTYAHHHDLSLTRVTADCRYDRVFADDCEDCEGNNTYEEVIREHLTLEGDLTDQERTRLHQVAKACSIRRMLESGIQVHSD